MFEISPFTSATACEPEDVRREELVLCRYDQSHHAALLLAVAEPLGMGSEFEFEGIRWHVIGRGNGWIAEPELM